MSKISYILEFTIAGGKADEFKTKAQGYIDAVQKNEPGTLGYQWYVDDGGTRCLVHETFASSEALLAHLQHVGPSLPELLAIAPITRLEVLGSASTEAKDALAALGAVHFPHLGGFAR
jgi:quinol monooxygenase YgiN